MASSIFFSIRQKDAWLQFLETGRFLKAKTGGKKRMNNYRRRQSLPSQKREGEKTLLIFLVLSNHFVPSRRSCDTEWREKRIKRTVIEAF